jgi:hypothetical protein
MRRLASLAMGCALVLAFAAPAAADTTGGGQPPGAYSNGMTLTITSARLVARVVVEVTVDVTCEPAPDGARWEDSYFTATVKQASGRAIAFGSTEWWSPDLDVLCDGESHRMTVAVPADQGSVPFKRGVAAIEVRGSASYYEPCGDEWCDSTWGSRQASTGWLTVRLGR